MKKFNEYSKNGLIIFGLTNAFINVVQQVNSIKENPDQKFDWSNFLKAGGKGALLGALGGAFVGGLIDSNNYKKKRLNTSAILSTTVSNIRLNRDNPIYKKLSLKSNLIINDLEINFKDNLGDSPLKMGSTEDGTSLSDSFDIDISVPFSAKSFKSTSEMFKSLYHHFDKNYSDRDLLKIRKQKKSLGIIYRIDNKNYKIDIVPYKLSKSINSKTAGYLYINNNSIFKNNSYTKTDIVSLNAIKLTDMQKKILIALKNWKEKYSVPISSHLLKMLLLKAFESNKGNISKDFTEDIIMVINYINENIMTKRIISIENTNNVLTNLSRENKTQIEKECSYILSDYEYQPNSILNYFNEN